MPASAPARQVRPDPSRISLALCCTTCHSTHVIPFRIILQPGVAVSEQVIYAAKKALVSGQMRPGEPFPSVRNLSKALKINPNTAHKVVTQLLNEGLLEVLPGIGTVVARPQASSAAQRARLLRNELEQLVVEAKHLGLPLAVVEAALQEHWQRLNSPPPESAGPQAKGGRKTE